MNKNLVKIGMKVIPYQKTAFTSKLEQSNVWKRAKSKNQEYLYVIDYDSALKYFVLDDVNMNDGENGDYFRPEDFEPYIETNVEELNKLMKQQTKILNTVEKYMNKYPFAKEGGSEYISQSNDPQIGAIDLACELADIYCEYN